MAHYNNLKIVYLQRLLIKVYLGLGKLQEMKLYVATAGGGDDEIELLLESRKVQEEKVALTQAMTFIRLG